MPIPTVPITLWHPHLVTIRARWSTRLQRQKHCPRSPQQARPPLAQPRPTLAPAPPIPVPPPCHHLSLLPILPALKPPLLRRPSIQASVPAQKLVSQREQQLESQWQPFCVGSSTDAFDEEREEMKRRPRNHFQRRNRRCQILQVNTPTVRCEVRHGQGTSQNSLQTRALRALPHHLATRSRFGRGQVSCPKSKGVLPSFRQ
jgi:hypothetical protein